MKTETEANFSRSMPLWKIRISFLLKKEIKTRNLFSFVYTPKERQRKPGSDQGRATTVANPGPLGSAQKKK
jgi:hypothetical protein